MNTQHVFLDIEVYRRYCHNLNDLQLTKGHISILHITDIALEQVKRQLRDMSAEVAQAVNKANRSLRNWPSIRSRRSGIQPVPADMDAAVLDDKAVHDFDITMITGLLPKRHDALNLRGETGCREFAMAITGQRPRGRRRIARYIARGGEVGVPSRSSHRMRCYVAMRC